MKVGQFLKKKMVKKRFYTYSVKVGQFSWKIKDFFHESVISRVSQFRMRTFPQGILECRQAPVKGTPGCPLSWGKRGWCRNDQNGPLENVHFVL